MLRLMQGCFRLLVIILYEYKTAAKANHAEFIEKKSRFISHILPVECQRQAVSFINEIKTKFWDASHNVYAYVLKEDSIARYSDDGEPLGTAGVPTLNVIQKEGLINVCIVTTRYFGGIQLGAGGLVRAYTKSAKNAVNAAGILRRIYCYTYTVRSDYALLGKIQNAASNAGCIVDNIDYAEDVKIKYFVPYSIRNFSDIIKEVSGAGADISKRGKGEFINAD